MNSHFIKPNWPAPPQIKAYTTLRSSGNLAEHVNDDPRHVQTNRELLKKMLSLPSEPIWLNQTHSTIAIPALLENKGQEADASFTHQPNQVCVVMTADCLPLLICDRSGKHIAAIHAGWRGLANGVIERTLKALSLPPEETLVWLGPAIGPERFEVGNDVRDLFIQADREAENFFTPTIPGKWLGDMYALARFRLKKQGITAIYGGEYCTYSDEELFFSYRRDGDKAGRMASLIWIEEFVG